MGGKFLLAVTTSRCMQGHCGAVSTASYFTSRDLSAGLSCHGRCGVVSLDKVLHTYVHCLDPGVNGYLVG